MNEVKWKWGKQATTKIEFLYPNYYIYSRLELLLRECIDVRNHKQQEFQK